MKKQTKQASSQAIWQEGLQTNTQENTLARKHTRKPKQGENYQQLSLFTAFSSIWQSPVP